MKKRHTQSTHHKEDQKYNQCQTCSCSFTNTLKSNNSNNNTNEPINHTKRSFLTNCIKFMSLISIYYFFSSLLQSMFLNDNVLENEYIEIDLNDIKEGNSKTVYWQGKPIFIKHRTIEEIYNANNTNLSQLKDPENDNERIKQFQEKWLVVIGICTHLGCIPVHNKGKIQGGWLCPCHNSEYDTSGRVISGPAPKNLKIPPYKFLDNNLIRIG